MRHEAVTPFSPGIHSDAVRQPLEGHEKRELRINLWILLVILLALCVVGRKTRYWPIMTWPMYSTRSTGFPASRASLVELCVVTRDGERLKVTPRELFPKGQDKVSKQMIANAYRGDSGQDETRKWLVSVIRSHFGGRDLAAIEGWQTLWDVDPMAVPPLDRHEPTARILLGSFPLEDPHMPDRAGQ